MDTNARNLAICASLIAVFTALPNHGMAAENIAEMKTEIDTITSDPEKLQASIEKGKELSEFCGLCHGHDGNSVKNGVPNLASQNPAYLATQFNLFADGKRQDFTGVMQSIVKNLSHEDRVTLAVYFSSMPLKPLPYDADKANAGKQKFLRVCSVCHGLRGEGKEEFAHIGGQHPDYILRTLKNFRDNKQDKWQGREATTMPAIVKNLSDAELDNLAHYITSLGGN